MMIRIPRTLHRRSSGFTLVEMLVVIAITGALLLLVRTSLARTKPGGQIFQCLNNQRQLIAAWQMYADDSAGWLVENYHGGEAADGSLPTNARAWAAGWQDWGLRSDNTNTAFLTQDRYARLATYYNRDTRIYQCPADVFTSVTQKALGWSRRARSYSLNMALGAGNAYTGPWDPVMYRQMRVMTDLNNPGAAETFAFIEEHPDSMNDPGFQLPLRSQIRDMPSNLHNGSCAVSFTDGHAEIHSWMGAVVSGRANRVSSSAPLNSVPVSAGDADLHWLSFHSPRSSSSSY